MNLIEFYNWFEERKNIREANLGQIRVTMKKRLDMIDQLIEIVKNYAKFEQYMLEEITKMRSVIATAGLNDLKKLMRTM